MSITALKGDTSFQARSLVRIKSVPSQVFRDLELGAECLELFLTLLAASFAPFFVNLVNSQLTTFGSMRNEGQKMRFGRIKTSR